MLPLRKPLSENQAARNISPGRRKDYTNKIEKTEERRHYKHVQTKKNGFFVGTMTVRRNVYHVPRKLHVTY